MTENRMQRVKVMLGSPSMDTETSEQALITAHPGLPNQALQVLTMAQRTAEEHVQTARAQADKIRTEALAAAEQTAQEAEQHAHKVRRDADKLLFDARAAAEQAAREAQARAEAGQRTAEKIESDGRALAEAIAAEAQAKADDLAEQAQRRYDDVVGSLGAKREALQSQIEALEQFDREYRTRLTAFMQGQLRALWVDQPQVSGELDHIGSHSAQGAAPAAPAAQIPAPRQSPERDPDTKQAAERDR